MPKRFFLTLALLIATALPAQTLARPGWVGSGLNLEAWWTHAVLYRLDPHTFTAEGLKGATGKLDYIHSLGMDAITLTPLPAEAATSPETVDPALGTLDDFDDLVREASRSTLRVLVELDPAKTPDLARTARFWLGHGVGGIRLGAGATAAQVQSVRAVTKSVAGQRIVAAETSGEGADLTIVPIAATALDAATLRPVLAKLSAAPDARPGARPVAEVAAFLPAASKAVAALLLATHSNAQVLAGQEIGQPAPGAMPWGDPAKPAKPDVAEIAGEEADADSPLNWYRRLIDLHHGNGVFRAGTADFLDHDAQNSLVWVMRKAQVTPTAPAVVVAVNLSDKPVTLSLTDDLRALHLRGNFLRTLARSDKGLGGVSLNAIALPPFGVYIGELRL